MKTQLFTCLMLCSLYSFGQYPSTIVGYKANAPAITDLFSQKFMPSSFIDAKGTITTTPVDAATGLYVKANNSSNLPDVGIAVELGNTSNTDKFGFFGNGTFNTTKSIFGMTLYYKNTGTGKPYGASISLTGNNPWGFDATVNTNLSTGTAKGGDFYAIYEAPVVAGQATAKGLESYGNAGTAYGVHAIALGSLSTTGVSYGIYAKGSGALTNYAGYFEGNVTVTGTFSNPSDAKLKRNVTIIGDALSKVMQLNPSNYEFKTDTYKEMNLSKGVHYGFLAQDMEKVFPNLVSESSLVVGRSKQFSKSEENNLGGNRKAKEESETVVSEPIKTVNYLEMIPILTKAIQEQQLQIEALKAEIKQLKGGK